MVLFLGLEKPYWFAVCAGIVRPICGENTSIFNEMVVPVERIELPTFGLQNRCSTAELNRQQYQWVN
jgi:hypothetical protein